MPQILDFTTGMVALAAEPFLFGTLGRASLGAGDVVFLAIECLSRSCLGPREADNVALLTVEDDAGAGEPFEKRRNIHRVNQVRDNVHYSSMALRMLTPLSSTSDHRFAPFLEMPIDFLSFSNVSCSYK